MPEYKYKAIDENGNPFSDVVEADSLEMANNILIARGYIPIEVSEKRSAASAIGWRGIREKLTPIKPPELILFTKQFRTLLRSGVSMVKLLQVLESQTENPNLKKTISTILHDIQEGSSLYNAFKKHPKAFSTLYCSMVHAGEASGALPEVLERLTYIIDHEHKVKSDVKAAFQYPLIVIIFLAIAFFVLLTFVIPRFVNIFTSAGLDLPIPTRICMFMYQFMSDYWYLLTGCIAAGVLGLNYYFRTEQGRFIRDSFLMRLPLLGPLFIKAAMSRFASIFAILQSSGITILDSMKILSKTIGNTAIAREFDQINEQLEEGRGIAVPLKNAKYFTPIVINMIAIGEESGNLDELLGEISEHYDVELEYALKKLTDSIGPVLTVCLAAVVGFFALAIFLPMWDLLGVVK